MIQLLMSSHTQLPMPGTLKEFSSLVRAGIQFPTISACLALCGVWRETGNRKKPAPLGDQVSLGLQSPSPAQDAGAVFLASPEVLQAHLRAHRRGWCGSGTSVEQGSCE